MHIKLLILIILSEVPEAGRERRVLFLTEDKGFSLSLSPSFFWCSQYKYGSHFVIPIWLLLIAKLHCRLSTLEEKGQC